MIHGSTANLSLRDIQLAEWAKPLNDGDTRTKFATNFGDKVHIVRTGNTYRIIATDCWGSLINHGGTAFESTAQDEADARARADFMAEVLLTGGDVNEALNAHALAQAEAAVVEAAEQITADAVESATVAPALKATHQGVKVRDSRLTPTQRAAINAAVNGFIGRSEHAPAPTLRVLAKKGWGELIHGDWSGTGRTNEITGLRLTGQTWG